MTIACLFPGQGSQQPGAGVIYRDTPAWEHVATLSSVMDTDLEFLLLEADADELRKTENTQSVAFCRNWLEWVNICRSENLDTRDDVVFVGHSVGEYSALAAARALDPLDAATVVAARGRAMAAACGDVETGMIAISGDGCVSAVDAAMSGHGYTDWEEADVTVANVNSPRQVVIAGPVDQLRQVADTVREADKYLRTVELPVSGAFHTRFMRPARADIAAALRKVVSDRDFAPVVSNRDGEVHTSWASLFDVMIDQVVRPVRWDLCGRQIGRLGVDTLWESAPKAVLSGFAKRANPGVSISRLK